MKLVPHCAIDRGNHVWKVLKGVQKEHQPNHHLISPRTQIKRSFLLQWFYIRIYFVFIYIVFYYILTGYSCEFHVIQNVEWLVKMNPVSNSHCLPLYIPPIHGIIMSNKRVVSDDESITTYKQSLFSDILTCYMQNIIKRMVSNDGFVTAVPRNHSLPSILTTY